MSKYYREWMYQTATIDQSVFLFLLGCRVQFLGNLVTSNILINIYLSRSSSKIMVVCITR